MNSVQRRRTMIWNIENSLTKFIVCFEIVSFYWLTLKILWLPPREFAKSSINSFEMFDFFHPTNRYQSWTTAHTCRRIGIIHIRFVTERFREEDAFVTAYTTARRHNNTRHCPSSPRVCDTRAIFLAWLTITVSEHNVSGVKTDVVAAVVVAFRLQ